MQLEEKIELLEELTQRFERQYGSWEQEREALMGQMAAMEKVSPCARWPNSSNRPHSNLTPHSWFLFLCILRFSKSSPLLSAHLIPRAVSYRPPQRSTTTCSLS